MADLMTAVHLKNPEVIMQALTPFPHEHPVASAQMRKFLPFNSKQISEILSPNYYSDLPGYKATIENSPEFQAYRPNDMRDAHLVFAPMRIFIWNRLFKGKSSEQQKNNLCSLLEIINHQFNLWGAWQTITPLELNKKIILSLNSTF